jgi:hypothetical protein
MSPTERLRKPLLGLVCVLTMLQICAAAEAQADWEWGHAVHNGLTRERIVGLIDIPGLDGNACGPEVPVTIDLYGIPSKAKPPIGVLEYIVIGREPQGGACSGVRVALTRAGARAAEVMPVEESGYEIKAVIAYERVGQWFRIALPRGSAWMMSSKQEHFHPYPTLLKDSLAFMTAGWDGRLWRTPDTSSTSAVPSKVKALLTRIAAGEKQGVQMGNVDVDVLAIRRVAGEIWIQVRVTEGHCGDDEKPATLGTGWLPAHRPDSKPSVWFSSRGC